MKEEKLFDSDVIFGRKGRKAYTEWFLSDYGKDPMKSKLIKAFGEKYYNEVMRIHQERMEKDDFMIGPQSPENWENFRLSLKNK